MPLPNYTGDPDHTPDAGPAALPSFLPPGFRTARQQIGNRAQPGPFDDRISRLQAMLARVPANSPYAAQLQQQLQHWQQWQTQHGPMTPPVPSSFPTPGSGAGPGNGPGQGGAAYDFSGFGRRGSGF
jgi:hypothetical protein